MSVPGEYRIKVLDKVFKIIDVLESEKTPLGVNDISRKAALNVATAFRILRTLMDYGWVFQDSDEKYAPGYKLSSAFQMGHFYYQLKDTAYCVMRRVTDREGEVLNLSVRQNEMGVLLQQSRTSKFADYVMQINSIIPLYATACGKILLSELPEPLLEGLIGIMKFKPYTERTICDAETLRRELRVVRECGFATDKGESLQNTNCIGVPVRAASGEIIASLSFSGLICELTKEKERYYVGPLNEAAAEISSLMFRLHADAPPKVDAF